MREGRQTRLNDDGSKRKKTGNIVRTHGGKKFKDGKVKIKHFSSDNAGLKGVKKYVQNCVPEERLKIQDFDVYKQGVTAVYVLKIIP